MTEKFKILAKYIKDMSSETPDIETFLFVKENISKYQLNIDIASKALKNNMIEIHTTFKFEDKEQSKKKSYFEIIYSTIIKLNSEITDKKELEKLYTSSLLEQDNICISPEVEPMTSSGTALTNRKELNVVPLEQGNDPVKTAVNS